MDIFGNSNEANFMCLLAYVYIIGMLDIGTMYKHAYINKSKNVN